MDTSFQKSRVLLVIFLVVAIVGDVVLFHLWMRDSKDERRVAEGRQKYPYISEEILEGDNEDILVNFLPLRKKLFSITDPYKDSFAMYFEYLPSGTSIGVNRQDEFTAASLLKVPVVMAYYDRKEKLGIKDDQIVTVRPNELNDKFGSLYKKGAGYQLSLDEAVRLAITESDNTASLVIADHITNDDYKTVYDGLDIPLTVRDNSPVITASDYTDILKSLYYASVLSKEDSQKILEVMTKTKFKDMLPAGVPGKVAVAHKIGLIDNQIYQDCGIVYVPRKPYALCMISKSDKKTAQQRMKTVSKTIYDYVTQH